MLLNLPFLHPRALRPRVTAVFLLVLALALAGCGTGDGPTAPADSAEPGTDAQVSGQVTVFAAASLTESFGDLADGFAAEHPDATVRYNFAGSQALASQIEEGAPADVYASANPAQMDRLVEGDLIDGAPRVFASNVLRIVVPAGNPAGVTGLEDLTEPDLRVVLAAEDVPVGAYTREALDLAGVEVPPVSLESNVKQVVTKVALGEADAGIVYATDVTAEGDAVEGIEIPEEHNVPATYPVAATAEAADAEAARAFVDYVLSPDGQRTLEEFGFLPADR